MKITTAVIAAAGFGSRFLPIVKSIPKEMLPIVDKPIIQLQVEECLQAGIEKIIIVVRKGNSAVNDYFKNDVKYIKDLLVEQGKPERFDSVEKVLDMSGVVVVEQDPTLPYGNGSPLYTVKDMLPKDEPFIYFFGDDLVLSNTDKGGVKQIIEYYEHTGGNYDGLLAGQRVARSEISKYGIVVFKSMDEDGMGGVMDYQVEKPNPDEINSDVATYGRYLLTYRIFDYLKPNSTGKDGELWAADAMAELARHGLVRCKILDGEWLTTGDPTQYFGALVKYYLKDKKYGEMAKSFLKNLRLD